MSSQKPMHNEGDTIVVGGRNKTVTYVAPVLMGEEIIDFVYRLDDDFDQTYNTQELEQLIQGTE